MASDHATHASTDKSAKEGTTHTACDIEMHEKKYKEFRKRREQRQKELGIKVPEYPEKKPIPKDADDSEQSLKKTPRTEADDLKVPDLKVADPYDGFIGITYFTIQAMKELVHILKNNTSPPGFSYSGLTLYKYKGKDPIVQIPEGTQYIAERAFANNKSLEEVIQKLHSLGLELKKDEE